MDVNTGGTVRVYRYLRGSATTIPPTGPNQYGGPVEGSTPTGVSHCQHNNRVCQWEGNELYAFCDQTIKRWNDDTATWTTVHTLTSASTAHCKFGPVVMPVSGVPTMVCVYMTNVSGTWRFVTSTDGTTWTETGNILGGPLFSGTIDTLGASLWSMKVIRDTIVQCGVENGGFMTFTTFNPATSAITKVYIATDITKSPFDHLTFDHLMFNGRHYIVSESIANGTAGSPAIYEFSGGSATEILNMVTGTATVSNGKSKWCLFTDGTFLYALCQIRESVPTADTAFGWHCYKLTDTGGGVLTHLDITNLVMPSAIGRDSGAASPDDNSSFFAVHDQEANPGGVPEILLYYRADGGTGSWDIYKWNGDSTLIGNAGSPTDVGGDARHAMSWANNANGKQFWTQDELDITIDSISPALGGETVAFTIRTANVRLLHGTVTSGPFQVGETITGGSSGATGTVVAEEDTATDKFLLLDPVTGTFESGETISGGTSFATAVLTQPPVGGNATVDVSLYYSTEGESPQALATLAAPSSGTLDGGNQIIQGLAATPSGNSYSVRWNVSADGVNNGDRALLVGRVFV